MIRRICISCLKLYDRDTSPGKQRCKHCQQQHDRNRNQRTNTTRRGYGAPHQQLRKQLLAQFQPGQLCPRCHFPIMHIRDAQLGHDDNDRTIYTGLEHRWCNEATAGRHAPKP